MRGVAVGLIFATFSFLATAEELRVVATDAGSQSEIGSAERAVHFRLSEPDNERWPASVTATITTASPDRSWSLTLEPALALKPHTIHLPAGAYVLAFSALHYKTLRQEFAVSKTDVNLGVIALSHNPVLSGSVISSDGTPLAGVLISNQTYATKSDELGTFVLEIDRSWPPQLDVSFPGFGTKELVLPKAKTSARLPAVTLTKGARIRVDVAGTPEAVAVDLIRESGYRHVRLMKSVPLPVVDAHAEFQDVDQGNYVLVVRGRQPLQRLAVPIKAGEGETIAKSVVVDPIAVAINVRRSGKAVDGAFITVQGDGNRWTSDLRTNESGFASSEAWQRGSDTFIVRATDKDAPIILISEIEGGADATVHLELPDHGINGRITDDDGTAVSQAIVSIESRNDDGTSSVLKVPSDVNGRFVVNALRDGAHTLVAESADYLRSGAVTVRLDTDNNDKEINLHLTKGSSHAVRVVRRDGAPIRNAFVIVCDDGNPIATLRTDDSGRGTVHAPADHSVVLYVVPDEGSFAIARLPLKASDDVQPIVIADGNATLELHADTTSGKPIPNLHFLMRYDGEMIPIEVAEILEMQRGLAIKTGLDGAVRVDRLPQGFLELWPVRTHQEIVDIIAGGQAASVRVTLKEGLNVTKMTFAPREGGSR